MGVGKEAIRKGLIEGGGAKVVGSECIPGEKSSVVDAAMVSVTQLYRTPLPHCLISLGCQAAFRVLQQPSIRPVRLDPSSDEDSKVMGQLLETLGKFFGERLAGDGAWARGVLGGTAEA